CHPHRNPLTPATMPPKIPPLLKPIPNILLSLPIALFFTHTLYSPAWVTGPSMSPTLSTRSDTSSPSPDKKTQRDLVLLSHFNAHNEAQRGEIVSFISPVDPERTLVKRVIGVEGDLVWCPDMSAGRARLVDDGRELGEAELREGRGGMVREVLRGHVWVEGDGRRWSRDSREFGPVC